MSSSFPERTPNEPTLPAPPHAPPRHPRGGALRGLAALALCACVAPVAADVWLFEPSVTLDQRFDDNYRLETGFERRVSATRVVGDLGLSRESQTARYRGALRVDGLFTQDEFEGDLTESNQILFLDSRWRDALTTWGVDASFKQDTPSRDISTDVGSTGGEALDNGIVTQRQDVARRRLSVVPSVRRELTRRASVDARLTLTDVRHDLPSAEEAIYERYVGLYNAQNRTENPIEDVVPEQADGSPLASDEVSIATPGIGVFTPDGELDDYREARIDLAWRYRLSPIATFSTSLGYSYYVADVEPAEGVNVPFEDLEADSDVPEIRRRPRGRDAISTTSSFRLGYERALSPTLTVGIEGGLYFNTTDDSDTFREEDLPNFDPFRAGVDTPEEYAETLEDSDNGWLANLSIARDAGVARYSLRFAVDVQPSSVGSQVESQELIADYVRALRPLLDFGLRARAYEPDRLGADPDDEFARRFISVEPRLVWRFGRAWTASAAYRYRRQKSRAVAEAGDSNAVLLSLSYAPPSALRDAARGF